MSIILLNYINSATIYSQSIIPLDPGFNNDVKTICYDSSSNLLYAGGSFTSLYQGSMTMNKISKWNGQQWDSLGPGINDPGQVRSIAMYNGELIVGGTFDQIGNLVSHGLSKWNGSSWIHLADAINASSGMGCVQDLYVFGNDLYIGGCFDSINGIHAKGIARYDGVNWNTYPSLSSSWVNIVAIEIFNNELYVGGNFGGGPGKADLVKFDGTNWVTVGGGFSGNNTWVNDLEVYQNQLYVAGYFQASNGDPGNNIAIWDGSSWSQPDNGLMPSNVFDLHVFNGKLFAGGQIMSASGIPVTYVADWDGFSWSNFDGNILNNSVLAFASNNNNLFFGGGFYLVNGDSLPHIASYQLPNSINELELNCQLEIIQTSDPNIFTIYNFCNEKSIHFKLYNSIGQLLYETILNLNLENNIYIPSLQTNLYYIVLEGSKHNFCKKIFFR